MTFWKVSDTRMNCLITEAEIAALGYSLEDLTQDRERTEEFLNLLLKKGKEVLGLNTDNGSCPRPSAHDNTARAATTPAPAAARPPGRGC